MDIVEFAERVCNFNLSDWQKEFLRNAYDAYKNNKRLIYIPPRGNNKISFEILQSLAIIFSANEKGLIKSKDGEVLMGDFDILYLCDRKACETCHDECKHTCDIDHAVNRYNFDGRMFKCVESGNRTGLFEVE